MSAVDDNSEGPPQTAPEWWFVTRYAYGHESRLSTCNSGGNPAGNSKRCSSKRLNPLVNPIQ
jgi:hypothetical protein